jgi:hypothetical protein
MIVLKMETSIASLYENKKRLTLVLFWNFIKLYVSRLQLVFLLQAPMNIVVDSDVYGMWGVIPMARTHIREFMRTISGESSEYIKVSKFLLDAVVSRIKMYSATKNYSLYGESLDITDDQFEYCEHQYYCAVNNYKESLTKLINLGMPDKIMRIANINTDPEMFDDLLTLINDQETDQTEYNTIIIDICATFMRNNNNYEISSSELDLVNETIDAYDNSPNE